MSDWKFLNTNRVKLGAKVGNLDYNSTDADGFNGLFRFVLGTKWIQCLASDGMDWQHVSVVVKDEHRPPSWHVMCAIKELFWEADDWVIQFHPPKSKNINIRSDCLHLWRYTGAETKQPIPPAIMV
jgi:hypothetical protein